MLMLTAMGDLDHRLLGLAAGVDDYLSKPFEPRELLARCRSILRRAAAAPPEPPQDAPPGQPFGWTRLLEEERRLPGPDGAEVPLTAMEFDLLTVFLRHPRQLLSRERLSWPAHHREAEPGDRSIDIRIARLRRKVEPDPGTPGS